MIRREFAGLPIVVENPAGSTRHWYDRDGRVSGSTLMKWDYGFIEGHIGSDGDEVDCYLGPDEAATWVFIVHQLKAPEFACHDEDKVMLGFPHVDAARAAYLVHRNDVERAFGGMSILSLERFKRKLERRTGTGKIRHESWPDHNLDKDKIRVALEGSQSFLAWANTIEKVLKEFGMALPQKLAELGLHDVGVGGGHLFQVNRGTDGKLPTGKWDRGMTPGVKEKDGRLTEFSPRTFNQMIDNWLRRGEKLSLCYNHQSAYAKINGQPAPALAFYNAVAVVSGGQVVRFEKLGNSNATPPSVPELAALCEQLATPANPKPSPDGCWWYRSEHTEMGEQLLGGFAYLSPMFVQEGKDEQGRSIGYVIYDLAATNTAFQGGCLINLDALEAIAMAENVKDIPDDSPKAWKKTGICPSCKKRMISGGECKACGWTPSPSEMDQTGATGAQGAPTMKFNVEIAKKHLGLLESATDAEVKAAIKRKVGEFGLLFASDCEPGTYKKFADAAEEMAKHYEDAYSEDDDGKEDHLVMRRFATKFRKMAKDEDGEDKDKKDKEGAEAMERRLVADYSAMCQRLKIPVPQGATSKQLMDAITAAAVPASELPTLIESHTKKILAERDAETQAKDITAKAQALVESLDISKERRDALFTYANNPATFAAAVELAKGFPLKQGIHAQLFDRMTAAGAPVVLSQLGTDPRATQHPLHSGPDRRVVENELGVFVEDGGAFSKMAIEMADAKEGPAKQRIDAELNEQERLHPGMRLIIANKLLKKERPELWEAAERPQLM